MSIKDLVSLKDLHILCGGSFVVAHRRLTAGVRTESGGNGRRAI